jgi:hypothetical protein
MVYFKTKTIDNYETEQVENALRKSSIKRHTSLDFPSIATYETDPEKCFLGLENDTYLKIIRYRTPVERILPKLILRFDKKNFCEFQIRYSLISFIVFIILSTAFLFGLYQLIANEQTASNFVLITVLCIVFVLMTSLEYVLTKRALFKAISKP